MEFSGVMTALVTPFKNGDLDEASLARLVAQQMAEGVDGLVVSGTTAESPVLTRPEKKRIFEIVKAESGGRVPVVVGTGSNCTRTTVEMTQEAEKWGADAALVVVPYYNKPPQAGLVTHFTEVAHNTGLPVILYNVPSRTITSLSLESIVALSKIDNVIGIKEASADPQLVKNIVESCGKDFLVSSGDDAAYLKVIENGGRGVISVSSHLIGGKMKSLAARLLEGDQAVHAEYERYSKLLDLLFSEANPIPVKAALYHMGIIAANELRLPLVPMSEAGQRALIEELKKLELLS